MRVTDRQNYDSQDRASIAASRGKNVARWFRGYSVGLATRRSRIQFHAAATNTGMGESVFGQANRLSISPRHPKQLSLLPSAGR